MSADIVYTIFVFPYFRHLLANATAKIRKDTNQIKSQETVDRTSYRKISVRNQCLILLYICYMIGLLEALPSNSLPNVKGAYRFDPFDTQWYGFETSREVRNILKVQGCRQIQVCLLCHTESGPSHDAVGNLVSICQIYMQIT